MYHSFLIHLSAGGDGEGSGRGGSGWGTHVNPWLIHVNVWQKPLQYCKVISLQLIKINEKKRKVLRTRPRGTPMIRVWGKEEESTKKANREC